MSNLDIEIQYGKIFIKFEEKKWNSIENGVKERLFLLRTDQLIIKDQTIDSRDRITLDSCMWLARNRALLNQSNKNREPNFN